MDSDVKMVTADDIGMPRVPDSTDVDQHALSDGILPIRPPAEPIIPKSILASPTEIKKTEERLMFLINLLRGVGANNKLYKVTAVHRSPLDGEDETSIIYVWGKDERQAGYIATHDVTQRQWAKVDGRPELVRNAPVITPEWIARVLDLPIP